MPDDSQPKEGRTEFGYGRTICGCEVCQENCRVIPGHLIPADLERMIPAGADPLRWAEMNLLASPGALVSYQGRQFRIPTLVPASKPDGSCIHFIDGLCQIHSIAPFGCAFFDCRTPGWELSAKGLRAIANEWKASGLYARIWNHLAGLGKTRQPPEVLRERFRRKYR